MISGIGLYLKLCLDYHRLYIQNQLYLPFSRRFNEHCKTIKCTFIGASVFSGFSFSKDKKKCGRKFIVGGNWKMNGNKTDIKKAICNLKKSKLNSDIDIVVAVPSVYLTLAKEYSGKNIYIAAQNCYRSEDDINGEISPAMLQDIGIEWVIVGDCARRVIFEECDVLIGEKIEDALCDGIRVIACLVERKEDAETGKPQEAIFRQLKAINDEVNDWCEIILAYEPIWTFEEKITPNKVQEIHCQIRKWLKENVDEKTAEKTRIIYAGNVDQNNAKELVKKRDIDGFLIGEKSLTPEFFDIIKATKKRKNHGPCKKDHDKEEC